MRRLILAALCCALIAGAAVAQDSPPPAPPLIEMPVWLERPTGRDFAENYPRPAIRRNLDGQVVLDCLVLETGRLSCTVTSETPAGAGFGEASLRAAQSFRMAPQTANGTPTAGGRTIIPMRWTLPH